MTKLPEELKILWAHHAHRKMKKLYVLPHSLKFNEKLEFIKEFKTFTFVRHPFIRIVSTFRDKIINRNYLNWTSLVAYKKNAPSRIGNSFRRFVTSILRYFYIEKWTFEDFFKKGAFFSGLWGYFPRLTKRLKIFLCLFNKKVIRGGP